MSVSDTGAGFDTGAVFNTIVVADWSAGKRRPARPSKDAIWLGIACGGVAEDPIYCRSRQDAEAQITQIIDAEVAAGRRLLLSFDFPFGYPRRFARHITGSDDPFTLWDWISARITDTPDGTNNRYAVAEEMNAQFEGPGPFWGKPNQTDWPGVPYRKAGISYDTIPERRTCDLAAKAASSCFQLAFPPTVGGQILMGLPTLNRLRQRPDVAVWPFGDWTEAPVVLAEIWPGLIEPAVKATQTDGIRDAVQVRLLATALSRLPAATLHAWMTDLPDAAREEAWILGAGHTAELVSHAEDTDAAA
ncbi:molybdopterin guanine dinucleotide synthesis [Tateyamaria sp. syn59]|uniref:molybdopterin guanine dinucleotide synthesis n=1 Tax=Tateyamaria sp. syn59 TaxID=2576942 RepID=UPI0011BFA9DF